MRNLHWRVGLTHIRRCSFFDGGELLVRATCHVRVFKAVLDDSQRHNLYFSTEHIELLF